MSNPIDRWLTAWVDGELSPQERQVVADLLRDHPGLEVILQRLQADSERLKALPRQALPLGFSNEMLAEIRGRNIEIIRQRRRPVLVRVLVPVAAAAAILVALGLTARHLLTNHQQGPPSVVKGEHRNAPAVDAGPAVADGTPAARPEVREAWDKLMARVPSGDAVGEYVAHYRALISELRDAFRLQSSQIVAAFTVPSEVEIAEQAFPTPTILTFPAGKATPFKTIDVRLPLFLDVRSLDSAKLLDRLREDSVHHLDLPCTDSWKALERFQSACRQAGVKVVLDAEAHRRLNGKLSAVYLIYAEDVAPELIARVMQALQNEDSAAERRQKGEGQFQSLMVQSLDEDGRKRLAETLGVPPGSLAPSRPPGRPNGIDTRKPLSNETLKSLEKVAAGQKSRPGRPGDQTAVVVVWHPRLRTPLSKEVRDLLDAKKPQGEGINVVFLFRPSRG